MQKLFEKVLTGLPPFLVFTAINKMFEDDFKKKADYSSVIKFLKDEDVVISAEDNLVTVYVNDHRYRFTREDLSYDFSWAVQKLVKRLAHHILAQNESEQGEADNTVLENILNKLALESFNFFNIPVNRLYVHNRVCILKYSETQTVLQANYDGDEFIAEKQFRLLAGLSMLVNIIKTFSVDHDYQSFECARIQLNLKFNKDVKDSEIVARVPDGTYSLLRCIHDKQMCMEYTPNNSEFIEITYIYRGYDFVRGMLLMMFNNSK